MNKAQRRKAGRIKSAGLLWARGASPQAIGQYLEVSATRAHAYCRGAKIAARRGGR